MGWFDKLFGKKKNESKRTESTSQPRAKQEQNKFLTNSADFGLGEIPLGIAGKMRVDGLLAIAAMEKIAKERGQDFHFSVMHTSLLEEGALTVPVVCSIGEDRYSIYFIYKEEELLKYKDLVNHVSRTPYPKLMYFSSIPIYDGYEPKPIIEPFQLADLRYDSTAKVAGKFAMWWSTDEDPLFHKSKTYEYLSKLNEVIKGYETYMTGYILRQARIVDKVELQRMRLPQDHATYVIDGPEEKRVLIDISQEKGIRFLFNMTDTPLTYRERFIRGAVVDLIANIVPLRQNDYPVDEVLDPNSYDWFNFMSKVVRQKEEEGELVGHQIGLIDFNVQMN